MIQEERLVELFKTLCLINAPALQERKCVDYVADLLKKEGLEVQEDDAGSKIGGNAGNLIAWLRGNPNLPKVFLSAHFDTVEPTEGLVIEERDGVFYSASDTILGADDKGGMAPAIEAVLTLRDSGIEHGDVCLLLSVAEEIGLKGADAVAIDQVDCDFGFVLDTGPPVGTFVNRTAFHDKLDVEIIGKPAHAGKDPENGINAIQVLAKAVSNMKLGRIDEETTANFGIISGGTAMNVVCANLKVRGEARSTSEEKLNAQIEHMKECFLNAGKEFGAEINIDYKRHYSAYYVPEDSPVVKVAQAASRKLGLEPTLRTTLGGSDANVYNNKGLTCIVVATGMEHIHTHDERISRKDLVLTAELALQLLIHSAELKDA